MTKLANRLMPWPADARGGSWARVSFAVTALGLLAITLFAKPLASGDAFEYLLQTESLARHSSPEVRAADVVSLARQDARMSLGLNFALGYRGYFDDPSGRWYACHFWGYSLLAVPARIALGGLGLNGIRAFPLTNAAFFLVALYGVMFVLPFSARARVLLFLLLLTSPAIFFLRWPHAESLTVSATAMALTMRYAGRPLLAIVWAALATLQSPPFVVLVALLWIDAQRSGLRWHEAGRATLAASLCLAAPIFYLWRFGSPSLIARESASLANLSVRRAFELFLDPQMGLVRVMPVAVALLAVSALWTLLRMRPFELALTVSTALMALACTPTTNWRHDTIGPSRYAVWLVPCVLFVVVRTADAAGPRIRTGFFATALVAVAVQAVLVTAAGGPLAQPESLRHPAPVSAPYGAPDASSAISAG